MIYPMICNYHTHTTRCQHAFGTDREYVEAAIKAGIKKLGFSDHVPYPFKDGYVSHIRMTTDETEDYVTSVQALKAEYKDDIEIFLGFEAEYLKDLWDDLKAFLAPYHIDYLILGQHFLGMEGDGNYCGRPSPDEERLTKYVDTVIEALRTNCFSYLAHPDLINFTGDEKVYKRQMTRLCLTAKELNIPLEINLLGLMEQRQYPSNRFFSLASSLGNSFILGRDAHEPTMFLDKQTLDDTCLFAQKHQIVPLLDVILRKPMF